MLYNGCPEDVGLRERLTLWKPLVLLIPLRLGLTEINEAYIETLKVGNLQLNSCWGDAEGACWELRNYSGVITKEKRVYRQSLSEVRIQVLASCSQENGGA